MNFALFVVGVVMALLGILSANYLFGALAAVTLLQGIIIIVSFFLAVVVAIIGVCCIAVAILQEC